jgi:asparagine synthase (glutamine-hydrolysing)
VPRKGFDGTIPGGCYADETPYVEAIRAEIGNIDITYVYNNEHDDFDEIDRVSLAFEYPVRNPTNLGWMLAIPRLARAQNRRVLLLGLVGNFTTGWNGWSQSCHHLLRGRLRLAYRQYRALYRNSKLSHWMAFRKLFVDPLRSDLELDLRDWYRGGTAPWQGHSPIRPEFAAEMQVDARAREAGHDFRYRSRYGERHNGMRMVDYLGDWFAAIKAMYGVEMRDPLADIDLVEYCFGIPDEQYLVEGIDRSLIRRAMWGLLPPSVLTNRQFGLQSADWYEKADQAADRRYRLIIARAPVDRHRSFTKRGGYLAHIGLAHAPGHERISTRTDQGPGSGKISALDGRAKPLDKVACRAAGVSKPKIRQISWR